MRVRAFGILAATALLAACGGTAAQKQADACAAAWQGGIAAAEDLTQTLTDGEPLLDQRRKDTEKALLAAEKRLAALTIKREEAATAYPDRVKGRVVSSKMRVGTIQAMRQEPGKPLAAVRFDVEIQGDYKYVSKTLAALYEQPKAFFVDRVEVNITDERKSWSLLKVQFHVFSVTEAAPAAPADAGLPAAYSSALSWAPAPECASSAPPAELAAARARLQDKEAAARGARAVDALDEIVKARVAIADDLVRQRDDDRAMWMAHSDELVEKSKTSVTGVAELRFTKGEPDWRL
jgi:hypothetical protein